MKFKKYLDEMSRLEKFNKKFKDSGIDEKEALKIIEKYGERKAVDVLRKKYPKITDQMIDDLIAIYATSNESFINESNEKVYEWKVNIKCEKSIKNKFENDLDKLFKNYINKTSDGYIEALY